MSALAYKFPEEELQDYSASSIPSVRPRTLYTKAPAAPMLRREAESVSPLAILGFLVACALVVCVLLSHIQLDRINDDTTVLTSQLSALQEEYEDLSAQYQQMFDMEGIKSGMLASGLMSSITTQQQIYMDLSQPDTSTALEDEDGELNPLSVLMAAISDLIP